MALTMTLTHQQPQKIYGMGGNCVIVSAAPSYAQQVTTTTVIQEGKRPLAPAGVASATLGGGDLRCKRKIQFGGGNALPPVQPVSVARRNARERNRVKQVNNGFAALRQHIPTNVLAALAPPSSPSPSSSGRGSNKKLSKVETLRLAVEYIRSLQQMLEDHEAETGTKSENTLPEEKYFVNNQYSQYPIILPTPPPSSEASSSPTPSDASSGTAFTSTSYKQYSYDNYEPNSPEDEDLLLDAIFHWQQSN